MPSNSNNQPVKNSKPWYKKSLDLSNFNLAKFFHSGLRKNKSKAAPSGVKKHIKDIRSKPMSDGTDGIGVENPDVLDIDLIKDEVPVIFDKKKNLYTLGAFALLSLFLVFEIYFFLYSWERQEIRKKAVALQEEATRLDQEITFFKAQAAPATEFKNKINNASQIFNSHIYWTNFLAFLEKNTLFLRLYQLLMTLLPHQLHLKMMFLITKHPQDLQSKDHLQILMPQEYYLSDLWPVFPPHFVTPQYHQ